MFYLILAYSSIWVLITGYLLYLHQSQQKLRRELEIIKEMIKLEE